MTENELIAELMEWIFIPRTVDDEGEVTQAYWTGKSIWREGAYIKYEELRFDKQWDWLMPAWVAFRKKIKDSNIEHEFIDVKDAFLTAVFNGDCKSAANAIVKGIKWYNSQTTKQ